jgi:hypothetical protein
MTTYFVIHLDPGEHPTAEPDNYVTGTQACRVVLACAEGAPASGNLERIRRDICDEIAFTNAQVTYTRGYNSGAAGRMNTTNLDWLARNSMHAGMIEVVYRFKYWGKYFPAVSYWDGAYTRHSVISMTGTDCAHCAFLAAREFLAAHPEVPAPNYANVLHVSADHEVMEPSSGWTGLIGENGEVELTSATRKLEFTGNGCGNCGFPGHNRSTCPRPIRFYDRIGVEIEGRFADRHETEREARRAGCGACSDGSIRVGMTACEALEIQTKPGSVTEALRQVAAFYPDESDASCGMHVHVSFHDMCSISQLATDEFAAYFKRRWQEWGTAQGLAPNSQFFRRLNGQNEYCVPNDEQDMADPWNADRYLQLNFLAWNEHKTVECRLLPMFRDARLAYAAIVELVSIYEDWLGRDCPALIPEIKCAAAQEVYTEPVVRLDSLNVASNDLRPLELSTSLHLDNLPPVANGCRRVCTTPQQRQHMHLWFSELDVDIWAPAA